MSNKIIEDLIACGVPSDTLIAVVKLIAEAEITERNRTKTRERVQRFRDRKRDVTLHNATVTLPNVTETLPSSHDGSTPLKLHEIPPETPSQMPLDLAEDVTLHPVTETLCNVTAMSASTLKKESKKEREGSKSRGGTRCPDDWTPTQADVDFALGKKMPSASIDIEAIKFRNYWTSKTGKDATKLDWGRTWQNWVLNSRGGRNGQAYVHAANPLGKTASDVAREVLEECCREERELAAWQLPPVGIQRP